MILLLASDVERTGFWLIPGLCLQVVVVDWFSLTFCSVFSALVCEVLPLEVLSRSSVAVVGGCSRTSGTL